MSVDPMTAETLVAAREQFRRGELTLTLVAKDGERFLLRDLGTLCSRFDGLIRAIGREVAPNEKVEWCVTALGLAGDNLAVTIGAFPPRKRTRRKAKP